MNKAGSTPTGMQTSTVSFARRNSATSNGSSSRPSPATVWADEKLSSFRLSKRSFCEDKNRGGEPPNDPGEILAMELVVSQRNDPFQCSTSTNLSLHASFKEESEGSEENTSDHSADPGNVELETVKAPITKFKRFRNDCGGFVNSGPVQLIMSILIASNAILLGAITFDAVQDDPKALNILEWFDAGILSCFTIEVLLHFTYLGFELFKSAWLMFDTFVVLFSWIFIGSSLSILRSVRIFRIFSLVSRWESLRTLFESVGATIPKMASIWMALMIVFYIFCVLYTTLYSSLYDDGHLDQDYFGSLSKSFVTLFQIMTLDNWSNVARQVMDEKPASFIGFFAFIVFTAFFVVNLVVAVICETLIHVQQAEDLRIRKENQSSITSDQTERLLRELLKNQLELQKSIQLLTEQIQNEGIRRASTAVA